MSEDQLVGILDQVESMEKSKSANAQQGTIKVCSSHGLRRYCLCLYSSAGGKVLTVMMMTFRLAIGRP